MEQKTTIFTELLHTGRVLDINTVIKHRNESN